MKECNKCLKILPIESFGKHKKGKDGIYATCRPCCNHMKSIWKAEQYKNNPNFHRDRNFKDRYGISLQERDQLAVDQDHRCKICLTHESNVSRSVLFVDHCHTSGEVRGLLCDGCNKGIGHLKDNPTAIKAALAYITNNGDI